MVEIVRVLSDVRLSKGGVEARELLDMEGIDMRPEVIEGVPTTISVVMPVKRVLRYLTIVWRALAVRVRVCISTLIECFEFPRMSSIYRFWRGEHLNSLSLKI